MTLEEATQIFNDADSRWSGDNALQGLQILRKYTTSNVLCSAEHDIIYSIDVEEAIQAGMDRDDMMNLALLNWGIDEEFSCFYCFV